MRNELFFFEDGSSPLKLDEVALRGMLFSDELSSSLSLDSVMMEDPSLSNLILILVLWVFALLFTLASPLEIGLGILNPILFGASPVLALLIFKRETCGSELVRYDENFPNR
jgi:hypothetical protein